MDTGFILLILRYVLIAVLTSGSYTLVMSLFNLRQSKKGRSTNTPTPRRGNMLYFMKDSKQFNSSRHKALVTSFASLPLLAIVEIILLLKYGFDDRALLVEGLIGICIFVMLITFIVMVLSDDRVRIKEGQIAYRAGSLQGILRPDEIRGVLWVEQKKAVVIYLHEGTELMFFNILRPKELVSCINQLIGQ